jgi:hypothetical protein
MVWSNDTNRDGMTAVSLIHQMNLESVMSKEYISCYVCTNYYDIMSVIQSCWRIQISI